MFSSSVFLTVQHAYARRAEHFVRRERQEVAIQIPHIDRHVRHACAPSTRISAPASCASFAASATGLIVPSTLDMCVIARDPRAIGERVLDVAGSTMPSSSKCDVAQLRSALGGDEMPRHDIAVVLHTSNENLVPGGNILTTPGVRHQVDRLGRIPREMISRVEGRADERATFWRVPS